MMIILHRHRNKLKLILGSLPFYRYRSSLGIGQCECSRKLLTVVTRNLEIHIVGSILNFNLPSGKLSNIKFQKILFIILHIISGLFGNRT